MKKIILVSALGIFASVGFLSLDNPISESVKSKIVKITNSDESEKMQRIDEKLPNLKGSDDRNINVNERVEKALAKFESEMAKIPEGELEKEREQLKKKTKELEAIPTPMPKIAETNAEGGMKWRKLTYPSGEVRYELPRE